MSTIQQKNPSTLINRYNPRSTKKIDFVERYQRFAKQQESLKVYWYMKAIIVIPCCIMVPSIIVMHSLLPSIEWFIGLSMIIFFSNLLVHISEQKTSLTIAVYYASIAVLLIIPLITYLISL